MLKRLHAALRADAAGLLRYFLIGCLQFGLDSLVLLGLTLAGIMPVAAANLTSRAAAALVGFVLNGKLTFGKDKLHWGQFVRFWLVWGAMTALSSACMWLIWHTVQGWAQPGWWLAAGKIGVELLLFLLTFQLMKRWVYYNRDQQAGAVARAGSEAAP